MKFYIVENSSIIMKENMWLQKSSGIIMKVYIYSGVIVLFDQDMIIVILEESSYYYFQEIFQSLGLLVLCCRGRVKVYGFMRFGVIVFMIL